MKYWMALVVMVISFPCLGDDMEQAVEEAKVAAVEAVVEAIKIDPAEFAIRVESDEEGDKYYYRRDKLVLVQREEVPVFRLCKEGVRFGTVVVEKDYSPHILLEKNIEVAVNLIVLEEGVWELSFYGFDPEYIEVYIVTSESVRPISAERYLERLAEAIGTRAAFESIFDSLRESVEDAETE